MLRRKYVASQPAVTAVAESTVIGCGVRRVGAVRGTYVHTRTHHLLEFEPLRLATELWTVDDGSGRKLRKRCASNMHVMSDTLPNKRTDLPLDSTTNISLLKDIILELVSGHTNYIEIASNC
jgi:hypothetical protein